MSGEPTLYVRRDFSMYPVHLTREVVGWDAEYDEWRQREFSYPIVKWTAQGDVDEPDMSDWTDEDVAMQFMPLAEWERERDAAAVRRALTELRQFSTGKSAFHYGRYKTTYDTGDLDISRAFNEMTTEIDARLAALDDQEDQHGA